jgi:hypothetical protein
MKDLSIILVSYNTEKMTQETIESVVKYTKGITYDFYVADNNSQDGSVEMLKRLSEKLPLTLFANKDNRGFGLANNQGLEKAKARYYLLLNTDTLVHDNVLGEMVEWMDNHQKVGISSCALKNVDGSLQGTGGYFPTLGRVFAWMFFIEDIPGLSTLIKPYHPMHPNSPIYKGEEFFKKAQQRDWLTGAYNLIRAEALKDSGMFDKDYFMYVEEVDLSFRAKRKGWEIWYLPQWSITHFGGASGTTEFSLLSEYKGIKIFYKKHMPGWQLPMVRLFLKLGALLRMIIFGVIKGPAVAKIYAKAFKIA